MEIKLRRDTLVESIMTKKLEEAIEMFGSTCGYALKTSGAAHLWEVNVNSERLDKKSENIYFTNQVANSNMGDWKKIKRCIIFIKQSKEDKIIIG